MDDHEKIKSLQSQVEKLSQDLEVYREQIRLLQRQLDELMDVNAVKPVAYQTPKKTSKPGTQDWGLENFIGLRLIHLVGIVVLVIGLSIGVKYAIDKNLISEMARIILAYSAGFVLYFLSLRLKSKYQGFSAILFSGGMASLYFTTYAAFVYYQLFPFGVAFALMIVLTLYTVYKAIDYNRQEIALLGLVGAYAIPFLVSKNADRADLFFLYISLINVGVVFLRIKKGWRTVARFAQAITWLLFLGWATMRFVVEMRSVGVLFMLFFFLLFSASVIIPKWKERKEFTNADIYQLTLNNLAFYTAALLVFAPALETGPMAIISLLFSLFVGLQSYLVYSVWREELQLQKLLNSCSLILFIVFIALQWEGLMVTLLWLLTAVLCFTWGVIRKSAFARITSILLMGVTLLKLLVFDSLSFSPVQKIISYVVLGILLLVVSFFYQKFKEQLFHDKE